MLLISVKEDNNINRVLAFIKKLLQLCFNAQTNFVVTSLILIGKIFQEKEALHIILKQKENCMREEDDENKKYDMFKREPIYSGAENTCLW